MKIKDQFLGINWGEIVYKPHSTLGPRIQTTVQLVIVHSGSAEVRVAGRWHRIDAGKTALLFPGKEEYFRFSREASTHHSWIHFLLEAEGKADWETVDGPGILPTGGRLAFVIGELLGIRFAREGKAETPAFALGQAALYDVMDRLGLLDREVVPLHPLVQRASTFIRTRYRDPLDLATLARVSGLSAQQLTRLFRDQAGYTPMRYLWRIREEAGRRLLRETGLTVAEIAEACGFANPFHFTRRIRERFGAPPRALRRRDWRGMT